MGLFTCCFGSSKAYFDRKEEKRAKSFYKEHPLSTPAFSLHGVKTWCRVVDVYDGDSITVVMPYKKRNMVHKVCVRLAGIDACEMNSKIFELRDRAIQARNRVVQLVAGEQQLHVFKTRKEIQKYLAERVCVVWIECYGMDKYKRVLADVYVGQDTISKILVTERLAYVYDGKSKMSEGDQVNM